MSQRDRVLSMLTRAGSTGVHSFEFYEQHMPRAAAVIHVLKGEGYRIESTPEARGDARGCRYVLAGIHRPAPASALADPEVASGLFAQAPSVRPLNPYDAEAA